MTNDGSGRISIKLGLAVFFVFFGFYLATGSRERPWGDANPVFEVADNLVRKASIEVSVRWPYDQPPGRNGKYYALNPLLTSLVHVPGAALRQALLKIAPSTGPVSLPLAGHVGPAALGALTCVLYLALARRFVSLPAASVATIFVGTASAVWVYARYPYSEILQTACFTGTILATVRALDRPEAREARWLGLWAGLLVNAKLIYFAAIPGLAAVLAWQLRRDPRRLVRFPAWAAATFVPCVLVIFLYNWLRWGHPLSSGYSLAFGGETWVGVYGLLFSPGKSVFLYSPPLIVAAFAIPALWREHKRLVIALAAAIVPVFWLYSRFLFWAGDYAWGPRYLVFAIPALLLPLALLIERARARLKLYGPVLAVFGTLGLAVQVLGNAYYWDHWIRISKEASAGWLGKPNRTGSTPPDRGGICDACFEDLYAQQWLPPFQPIVGHFWLLRHTPFGHEFRDAEKDAPWHMYTKLAISIDEQWYKRARIDWWGIDWSDNLGRTSMSIVFALFTLPVLAGGVLWWRRVRVSQRDPRESA